MSHYIVKLNDVNTNTDYYMIWSSVVDAPIVNGMSLEDFAEFYKYEYGNKAFEDNYNRRMLMVESKGTSALLYDSAEDLIRTNRAGDEEKCLTKEELIQKYCSDI